jgi:hypothetical protein
VSERAVTMNSETFEVEAFGEVLTFTYGTTVEDALYFKSQRLGMFVNSKGEIEPDKARFSPDETYTFVTETFREMVLLNQKKNN